MEKADTPMRTPGRRRNRSVKAKPATDTTAELILQQLHQVQEELEQHYLRCLDLDAELQLAMVARDDAKREAEALRAQVGHMQRELAALASVGDAPASIRSRLVRLLSAGFRRGRGAPAAQRPEIEVIRNCQWFDADWYLAAYSDVREAGMDPAEHFHEFGWKEGRNPGPSFDTVWYLRANPDVVAAGLNPLWHFVEYGCKEGRSPLDS